MNDLLLCLVGIAGDIFVHDGECFRINKTCDLFSMSEREQLKQLIPLGSAYLRLQDFISAHEARWDVRTETVDVYKMAMCSSISDFINRYCDDIAFIEEALDKDQSLTSTFILVHLQKVGTFWPLNCTLKQIYCLILFAVFDCGASTAQANSGSGSR